MLYDEPRKIFSLVFCNSFFIVCITLKSAPKDVLRFVVLIVSVRITLKLLRQNLLKNDALRLVKRGFETEFDVNND